ncbi:hypothetical protein M8J77_023667 [Diaphorina citri]|nr:hypothetical protein M8J77_023667 [Diaphorina citri]
MTVGKVKGFKVTNSRRTKLVGIAAKSLKELLAKSCEKFDMKKSSTKLVLLDGTLVESEEYFQTIPNQSVLMIQTPGEKHTGKYSYLNTRCSLGKKNLSVKMEGEKEILWG